MTGWQWIGSVLLVVLVWCVLAWCASDFGTKWGEGAVWSSWIMVAIGLFVGCVLLVGGAWTP